MKPRCYARDISEAVIAYCEAIAVPSFDEAVIKSPADTGPAVTSPYRLRANRAARSRAWPRVAVYAAALVALLVVLGTVPAVVAGVRLVFSAFTVASGGRTMPMTIREVSLERARADMPFRVIAPPSIDGAPIVAIDEVYGAGSPSDAIIVFEIHGKATGPELRIIESNAARPHAATLFALGAPADASISARLHSSEPTGRLQLSDTPAPSAGPKSRVALLEAFDGRMFTPASWVTRGTRIALMIPPGFLSTSKLRALQRAMSR